MPRRRWQAAATAYGLATAGYGVAVLRDPGNLLRPTAIAGGRHDGKRARLLARAAGVRDVASGLALVAAGLSHRPDRVRRALTARAVGDLTDVAWSLAVVPGRRKALVAGAAGAWAAIALLIRRSVPA